MTDRPRRAKRPTQADVARLAEVSQPVVSYVLNADAAAPVAPGTRRRVLEAIAQLGYVPDHAARALRRRRTFAIAGIIPDITNPFYPAFARGIQDVAERHGVDLISYNTDGRLEKERKALQSARDGRADGIIVVPFGLPFAELAPVVEQRIPVVVLSPLDAADPVVPIDVLCIDNAAAARAAVGYLLDRGHRRIGMVAGVEGTPPRERRVQGYVESLTRHGLPFDRLLVRAGEFSVEGGMVGAQELLRLRDRSTAIFAANDLMAMGAMLAIREAGLAIPDDVALVGFDDVPAAALVHPPLTTIAQHPERLGRRAAELLLGRLDGSIAGPGRREELPFDLIVRASA